jgi:hypothetical protein
MRKRKKTKVMQDPMVTYTTWEHENQSYNIDALI